MLRLTLISIALAIAPSLHANLAQTGLEISVTGDMVYEQGISKDSTAPDKLTMRGAEFTLYAPADHLFGGFMSAAAHEENGEVNFELHELFIMSSKLIPRTNLKVGQYFLGIGRINRFHQHDWPFVRAPKVHRTFFAEEGVFDSGIEASVVLPTPLAMNFTGGVTSGYRYGHSHTSGDKPKVPTHYARLSGFTPFGSVNGMEVGTSYLGRTDADDLTFQLVGLDLTAKWRQARMISYLLQSELWYRKQKNAEDNTFEQVGLYIFNEFALNQNYSLGLRLDGFKDLTKIAPLTDKKINHIEYGATAQMTFQSSEFLKVRGSFSHDFVREEGTTVSKDTRFELQFTFILGSHPAHDF